MSKQHELVQFSRGATGGGSKNLLINGSQVVAQRGASTTLVGGQLNFCTDRWHLYYANFDEFAGTMTQEPDAPEGFAKSLRITTTTPETAIAADEYCHLSQLVEGQNLQQLAYGTSAAKQLSLSFWVKSSITGTFSCGIYKRSSTNQISNLTYTINAANTWEYKTLIFAANTLSNGAIFDGNVIGFYVNWHIAAGSNFVGGGSTSGWVNYAGDTMWADGLGTNGVMTTANATFSITGVQLEVNDTSTNFEYENYATILSKCQRYYYMSGTNWMSGRAYGASPSVDGYVVPFQFPVTMRGNPAITFIGGSDGGSGAALSPHNQQEHGVSINLYSTNASLSNWWSNFAVIADAEL